MRRRSCWYRYLPVLMALVLTSGHVAGLQIIAWCGMFAERAQTQTVRAAVQSTFDGLHPCEVCLAVKVLDGNTDQNVPGKAGKDGKAPAGKVAKALVFTHPAELHSVTFSALCIGRIVTACDQSGRAHAAPPPTPPPLV